MSAYDPITEVVREDGTVVDLSAVEANEVYDENDQTVARKCDGCGDWYEYELWESGDGQWGNLDESCLCPGCVEQDAGSNYGSTMHRFVPGEEKSEHEYVLFGDHMAYGATEDCMDEPFGWFLDLLPTPWSGRKYVSTSGWRGHYQTADLLVGLSTVENGWMTGDYGDVPWKRDSHAFLQALSEGDIEPPCPVYVLFEPTSNVFSMGTDILCKTEDRDALVEWLEQSEYDLHTALG